MGFHVGQIFGDYSIVAVLGAGGMGRVYKVEHCLTKRIEAMKVLRPNLRPILKSNVLNARCARWHG